jgi:hypothetical protein
LLVPEHLSKEEKQLYKQLQELGAGRQDKKRWWQQG